MGIDVAEVVPIEIVEIRVQGKLGERVMLSARILTQGSPVAQRREGLCVTTEIQAHIATGHEVLTVPVAPSCFERLAAVVDERETRSTVTLASAIDRGKRRVEGREPSGTGCRIAP